MQKSTMLKLFEAAGYGDYKSMKIGEFYKPKRKILINTLDEEGNTVKKEVTGLVYKGLSKDSYKITTPSGSFLCTGEHVIYNGDAKKFEKVKEFSGTHGWGPKGALVDINIEKTDEQFEILDLEVDDRHCYLSAGILSHNTFGAQAKTCGIVIKRMNIFVNKWCTPVIWISQERANMDPMSYLPSLTGGQAVNFYPSTRFRVSPGKPADLPRDDNDDVIGFIIKLTNYKNKSGGNPFRKGEITLLNKGGLSVERDYINMVSKLGVIEQHGAWFYIWNPFKDMTEVKNSTSKKVLEEAVEAGDLIKCSGLNGVVDWWNSGTKQDWIDFLKNEVDKRCMARGADDVLDVDTGESEEAMLAEEAAELKKASIEWNKAVKDKIAEDLAQQALGAD